MSQIPASHWRRCFYCRQIIAPHAAIEAGQWPAELQKTREHVFPLHMVRAMPEPPPEPWRLLNRVFACIECNSAKGGMHPLDYAATLPQGPRDRLLAHVDRLAILARAYCSENEDLAGTTP